MTNIRDVQAEIHRVQQQAYAKTRKKRRKSKHAGTSPVMVPAGTFSGPHPGAPVPQPMRPVPYPEPDHQPQPVDPGPAQAQEQHPRAAPGHQYESAQATQGEHNEAAFSAREQEWHDYLHQLTGHLEAMQAHQMRTDQTIIDLEHQLAVAGRELERADADAERLRTNCHTFAVQHVDCHPAGACIDAEAKRVGAA